MKRIHEKRTNFNTSINLHKVCCLWLKNACADEFPTPATVETWIFWAAWHYSTAVWPPSWNCWIPTYFKQIAIQTKGILSPAWTDFKTWNESLHVNRTGTQWTSFQTFWQAKTPPHHQWKLSAVLCLPFMTHLCFRMKVENVTNS
jgi:hypothetical protein